MTIFVPAMGRVNTANRDGSEVRFAEMAKLWKRNGHVLRLLLPGRELAVLKKQGLECNAAVLREPLKSERDHALNIFAIYSIRILQSFFARYPRPVDIVYVPSDFLVDLIPGLICRLKNASARLFVCCFLIAPNPFRGYSNVYRKKYVLPSLRGVLYFLSQKLSLLLITLFKGKILVLNPLDKEQLVRSGIEDSRVCVVSMGVDCAEFDAVPEPQVKKYDAVFLGRLHPQKGLFDAVDIWKKVCEARAGARLAIIGGGSKWWFEQLNKRIVECGLKARIDVLGFREGREKIALLKASRCLIMPSHYESWGMVAVEAMACGLPVISYRLPVFDRLFPGSMVTVAPNDIHAFAATVTELLDDEEKRRRVASAGRDLARRFDWSTVAERELQVLEGGK